MNTYLGACVELGPEDVDADIVAASKVTYFEGYLWDPPRAKDAFRLAAEIAHANGQKVSITLSDPFCVDRYRGEFLELMRNDTVDIIFANEAELKSLYETADMATALSLIKEDVDLAAITRSEHGSIVVSGDELIEVTGEPVRIDGVSSRGTKDEVVVL